MIKIFIFLNKNVLREITEVKLKFKLILISIYCCVLQPALAGTEINDGGAGISINGEVATFYSAQMRVNPTPLTAIPSSDSLTKLIKKLDLPHKVQMELSENITPSFDRNYYAVSQEAINQSTLQIIKEEYSKITKIPLDQITIFALTDPEKKITLLLPDFFKLNGHEQVAILFHESLWINKRVKTYANMLAIEKDAQIYSMYPNDCVPSYNLIKKIESLFNENFWSLNSIFKCQAFKYRTYTNAASISMTDLFNSSEMDTFARIILTSLPDQTSNPDLYDLLLKQINDPANFKTFLESKRAFVEALKNDQMRVSLNFKNNLLSLESPYPESPNNVDAMVKSLNKSQLLYGFYDYDFFELNISDTRTATSIKMNILYK